MTDITLLGGRQRCGKFDGSSRTLVTNSFEGVEVKLKLKRGKNIVLGVFRDHYSLLQIIIANYSALFDQHICGKPISA